MCSAPGWHAPSMPLLDPAAHATLAALRETWSSVDDASRTYVADLRTDDLNEIVRYTNLKGEPLVMEPVLPGG